MFRVVASYSLSLSLKSNLIVHLWDVRMPCKFWEEWADFDSVCVIWTKKLTHSLFFSMVNGCHHNGSQWERISIIAKIWVHLLAEPVFVGNSQWMTLWTGESYYRCHFCTKCYPFTVDWNDDHQSLEWATSKEGNLQPNNDTSTLFLRLRQLWSFWLVTVENKSSGDIRCI